MTMTKVVCKTRRCHHSISQAVITQMIMVFLFISQNNEDFENNEQL